MGSRLHVVLVLDLAHDLLDDVLHRHQPGGAAVLVDHHREGDAAAPGTPSAARRSSSSPAPGRPGAPAAAAGSAGVALVLDQVAHARPRPRCRRGSRRRRAPGCTWSRASAGAGRPRCCVGGEGHDVGPRRHHVAHLGHREARHGVDQAALVLVVHGRRAAPRGAGRRPSPSSAARRTRRAARRRSAPPAAAAPARRRGRRAAAAAASARGCGAPARRAGSGGRAAGRRP